MLFSNEFILFDRIEKIKSIINQYGEDKFYISYSGGKDSTVLSEIVDMSIPDNKIPRVYSDTGIEYNLIRQFVFQKIDSDERFIAIQPRVPIKQMLEEVGYPFKSKEHSLYVACYQKQGLESKTVQRYLHPSEDRKQFGCPKKLEYQFTEDFNLKISNKCCFELKKKPLKKWADENNKPYSILGLRASEGGNRKNSKCVAFSGNKMKFNPLLVVSDEWIEWFISEYDVEISDLYKEPYNFTRSGCKGCPYNLNLKRDLKTMQKYFPQERKQCEIIWKPVYDEYRRIDYRLEQCEQMSIFDLGIRRIKDDEYID